MAKQEKSGQQSVGRAGAASADEARGNDPRRSSLGDLLSFYYPMHYRIGIDVETVMGQGRISRKQGTILWLIHSRGDKDGWLRRKLIEERLSAWFEISNSSVSNLLRELTRPPLELVKQIENPTSGREKLVCLTPKGRAFLDESIRQSIDYLGRHLEHVDQTQLDRGIQFFKLAFQPLSSDAPPPTPEGAG
ncbi:DNA-binding PadR family transcriptional regulator [Sphingopyxis italica]|jgi:DNA-binding PadR family transcriptional regulator|uniref:DNA-binding PadR family transcriptional regulator n=1 Tax=Sphingopyxis italica TaxID=1129133 RepID=A0A7X5XTU1_9SPHN|nr:MarR family transcriptional regulator [Sphingopyxis italica]MBD3731370.1 MarR family transcriptional regulator [Sphingopyxis sp.]NJB90096.1 DNA-binding PadR family transcriptional regulator [Sphingopyxis italica]